MFFSCLVRSADIWVNCSVPTQNSFWELVNDIYLEDPKYYHDIFSMQELINYASKLSEVKETTASLKMKLSQTSIKDSRSDDNSMQELTPILNVIEKLFLKGGESMSENVKCLPPILTSGASENFKFEILKLLKVLLVDTGEDPK